MPTLLPLTRTMYENARDAIFQEYTPTTNDDMMWLRGKWPRVDSMHFVLDADTGGAAADENTTCAIDTRYMRVLFGKMTGNSGAARDMVVGSFFENSNYVGMMQMRMRIKAQLININPKTVVGIYN